METITLPVWALATAVGLPGISLIWIIMALLRRRRKAMKAQTAPQMEVHSAARPQEANQFRNDLLAQQIDIVFNGLTALIETERVKLTTLLKQGLYDSNAGQLQMPSFETTSSSAPVMEKEKNPSQPQIDQQVAQAIADGQGVEGAAAQLGLSHAEVTLAMKLNQSKSEGHYRKLEAVA